jgi:hypothetical protein
VLQPQAPVCCNRVCFETTVTTKMAFGFPPHRRMASRSSSPFRVVSTSGRQMSGRSTSAYRRRGALHATCHIIPFPALWCIVSCPEAHHRNIRNLVSASGRQALRRSASGGQRRILGHPETCHFTRNLASAWEQQVCRRFACVGCCPEGHPRLIRNFVLAPGHPTWMKGGRNT